MTSLAPVLTAAAVTAVLTALPAFAQVGPWSPYGAAGTNTQTYAIERQRQQAQESEALARQQALQSRLTVMELQARRLPAPPTDGTAPGLGTPEQARAAREAATARRQTTTQGVGQIDSWLDRQPH